MEEQNYPTPWHVADCEANDGHGCWCAVVMADGYEESDDPDSLCIIPAGNVSRTMAERIVEAVNREKTVLFVDGLGVTYHEGDWISGLQADTVESRNWHSWLTGPTVDVVYRKLTGTVAYNPYVGVAYLCVASGVGVSLASLTGVGKPS